MHTLKEDINTPLRDVDRNWLRRAIIITSLPLTIPAFMVLGIMDGLTALSRVIRAYWSK